MENRKEVIIIHSGCEKIYRIFVVIECDYYFYNHFRETNIDINYLC